MSSLKSRRKALNPPAWTEPLFGRDPVPEATRRHQQGADYPRRPDRPARFGRANCGVQWGTPSFQGHCLESFPRNGRPLGLGSSCQNLPESRLRLTSALLRFECVDACAGPITGETWEEKGSKEMHFFNNIGAATRAPRTALNNAMWFWRGLRRTETLTEASPTSSRRMTFRVISTGFNPVRDLEVEATTAPSRRPTLAATGSIPS
jgi:hypothetical protein